MKLHNRLTSLLYILICAVGLLVSNNELFAQKAKKTPQKKSTSTSPEKNTPKLQPELPKTLWASTVIEVSSAMAQRGPYSASQLLGRPNIMSIAGNSNPCSWVAGNDGMFVFPNAGAYFRVGFSEPLHARQIALAENCNPGAVMLVVTIGENNERDTVYNVRPQAAGVRWRMLNIFFEPRPYKVKEVFVLLGVGAVDGTNEIDAIAISNQTDTIKADINLVENVGTDQPENLGTRINTQYDELLPVIAPDGKTLYFARMNYPGNIGGGREDIWFSNLQPDGSWGEAQNIGKPLNDQYSNFVCSITPDGNMLLLGNVYLPNGETGPGISTTVRTSKGWSFPEALSVEGYSNQGRYVNYFLAGDGKTLILSFQPAETYGDMDMFVSFQNPDGTWSRPKNLGPIVNTAGQEATAFLASDGKTLYFSSSGHNGYGSNDIFVTTRLDDTWQNWTEPKNLGPNINSSGWDAYFTVPASGDYAYMVSYKNSFGGSDIFRVKLPKAAKPKPVVLVTGKVLDSKTGKPLEALIRYESLGTGKELGVARSNPATGEYKISLPAGANYGFRAEADKYIAVSENLDLRALDEYKEITQDLRLVPIVKGEKVRLNNIFFETASDALKSESIAELGRVVELMRSNSSLQITIVGHTDNVGSDENNVALSRRRAQAVADYLKSKGVEEKRLGVKGMGKQQPETSNDTEEGRARNRRVEFVIDKE